MKKLYLIRHAKSDWSIQGQPDIDRHLNPRGYRDAHLVGNKLKEILQGNLILISSPAIRAISTALIIAKEINYNPGKIKIIRDIYEAEEKMYDKVISSIEDVYDTAIIFGHNPTISNVAAGLTNAIISELPTCSVSGISIETMHWNEFEIANKAAIYQLLPSELRD